VVTADPQRAVRESCGWGLVGTPESRAKGEVRLVLEVSEGWESPSARGLGGGDARLLTTSAAGPETRV
jgi:hypothetical protein